MQDLINLEEQGWQALSTEWKRAKSSTVRSP
jgi:hypothetical protein